MAFWPLAVVTMLLHGTTDLRLAILLFACLSTPLAVVAHELGHAFTALALGLEIGRISLGHGRTLWRFNVLRIPIEVHAWPLSGRVAIGSANLRYLRTRVWITHLMGPMTNGLLVLLVVASWAPLESIFGATILTIWVFVNALLGVTALLPRRIAELGQMASDGLALIEIPRATPAKLQLYLMAAPLMRALSRFEAGDFHGAQVWAQEAVSRSPDNLLAGVLLSACETSRGEYEPARARLIPALGRADSEAPYIRAAIHNNLAFAVLMTSLSSVSAEAQLADADRLSENAYTTYPCVLEYRSTRALILATTARSDQALKLLDYSHYETGTPRQRAHRETARALALHHLGRGTEALEAATKAVQAEPSVAGVLRSLRCCGVPEPA